LANDNEEVLVAIISLFVEDISQHSKTSILTHTASTIRFRKFACDTAYQRKGIGSQLLEYAVSFARSDMNGAVLWCDARTATLEWYQKRGFERFGETFYKGLVEYVRIKREIT
jgi:GNAT superfamily N-acetyltransferase